MASVNKVKNPGGKTVFEVRYRTPDGGWRRRRFPLERDAYRFATGTEHAKLTDSYVDPRLARQTLAAWWQEWWPTTVNLRPSTRARDESYARNHLLATNYDAGDPRVPLGATPLVAIDHLVVRTWVAGLLAYGLAPSTVAKHLQLLGKVLASAVRARRLNHNPVVDVDAPSIEHHEMRFFTPDEVAALVDAIDEQYRSLVLVGAYGGLRIGELAGASHAHLDRLHRHIDVAQIVTEVSGHLDVGAPKTAAGRRRIPLPRFVVDAVAEGAGPLFPSPKGEWLRPSLFRARFWQPACVKAALGSWVTDEGKPWATAKDGRRHYNGATPHALRHTAVAFWIAAGAEPKEIAVRAGHRSVVTVFDRYGHLLPRDTDDVTDRLDAMARAAKAPVVAEVVPLRLVNS